LGLGSLELLHHRQLRVLEIRNAALKMGDLLDQPAEGLGIGDRTIVDPALIPHEALPDRLEIGLGLGLVRLEIEHPGVGGNELGGECRPLGLQPGELGVLGQRPPTMFQLGDRAVDGLQIQQPELDRRVGLDLGAPCRSSPVPPPY
jgi:hypothetical protein